MKINKILALTLAFALIFALTACQKKQTGGVSSGMEPLPDDPVYQGNDLSKSPFPGSYVCSWSALFASDTEASSWEGRRATLEITEKGAFTLTVYSDEQGMVSVNGSVKVKDDSAVCTVSSKSAEGFLGDDVTEFTLKLISETELRYRGDQMGLTADRDIFTKGN